MSQVFSPLKLAAGLTEYWSPRVVGELDEHLIKVARVKGSLAWHSHEREDEFFYVLEGTLRIEMQGECVQINPGEAFVVPKGTPHNPVAEQECLLMLVERKTTRHTGAQITDRTRSLADQMRPLSSGH
jgi:mannose-6-phosphate isomerase-like protein (cupin superfamily)